MNDLAQILLQGGTGTGQSMIKGVFYRQFLPTSNVKYQHIFYKEFKTNCVLSEWL